MTFAGSIFLIVIGAILKWGVHLHIKHVDEQTIGLILIIAGVVGLIIASLQTFVWARRTAPRDDRYYDDRHY